MKALHYVGLICTLLTITLRADFVAYQAWYNPTTHQTIHEFYDIHASLLDFKDKLKQQTDFVTEAKKLNAVAIVEDHVGYHKKYFNSVQMTIAPAGKYYAAKWYTIVDGKTVYEPFEEWAKRNRGIPQKRYGKYVVIELDSSIYGLEELCQTNNVPCINIENRFGWGYLSTDASPEIDRAIIKAIEANHAAQHIFLAAGAVHIQNINTELIHKGFQPQKPIINNALQTIINSPNGQALKTFFAGMFTTQTPNKVKLDALPDPDLGTLIAHQIDVASIFNSQQPIIPAKPLPILTNKKRIVVAKKAAARQAPKPVVRRAVARPRPAAKPVPQKRPVPVRKPVAPRPAQKRVVPARKPQPAVKPVPKRVVVRKPAAPVKRVAPKPKPIAPVRKPAPAKVVRPAPKKIVYVRKPAAPAKKPAPQPRRVVPARKPVQPKKIALARRPAPKKVAARIIVGKTPAMPPVLVQPIAPKVPPIVQPPIIPPARMTPQDLFTALQQGNYPYAHTILEQNPGFINVQDAQGNTPIMLLIKKRHTTTNIQNLQNFIDYALSKNPDLNILNQHGESALIIAVEEYSEGIMSQLLENAPSITEFTLRNALARAQDNRRGTIRSAEHPAKLRAIITQLEQVLAQHVPAQQHAPGLKKKKGRVQFGDQIKKDVILITPEGIERPTPRIRGSDRD
jgi:hypothetical protein